jgi:alpha-tubulin suppressor-like RCC1 family protein
VVKNIDEGTGWPIYLTDVIDIAAGDFHFVALKKDGTVVSWGRTIMVNLVMER